MHYPCLNAALIVASCALLPRATAETAASSAPAKESPPMRFIVERIEDHRAMPATYNACSVSVVSAEDAEDPYCSLSARVTSAVDDSGRSLVLDAKAPTARLSYLPSRSAFADPKLRTSVLLRSPARSAAAIKRVEGIAEVYHPTVENEGLVEFVKIDRSAETLNHPLFEKHGIEVHVVSAAALAKLKASSRISRSSTSAAVAVPVAASDEQRRLQAIVAEVENRRASRGLTKSVPETARSDADRQSSASGVPTLNLQIIDPNGKCRSVAAFTSTGAAPMSVVHSNGSMLVAITVDASDARLVFCLASDAAITPRPFVLENIALP